MRISFDTKNPRFRLGGAAALSTIIVIAAAVLINLIAARVPLKADLSAFQLYSLSDQTKAVLSSLSEDVTVYGCFKEGSAPSEISEALKRYSDASSRIKVRYIDLERDPGFAKRYATEVGDVSPGSLVIAGNTSDRFKTIPYADLYEVGYDQQTGQQTVRGVQLERQVSGALAYVASGKSYKLYELSGHGEQTVAYLGVEQVLSQQNSVAASLNLLTQDQVPQDADLVVVLSPKTDLQEAEAEALRAYLTRGGKMLILIDPGFQAPRFAELLASLGVAWESGIVMEGDQGMRITGNPFFLLPELVDHEITAPLNKARLGVSYPASTALKESNLKRRDSTLSVLLKTSYNSWFRASLDDSTPTQKAGEAKGPFTLAYAVEIMRDEGKADPARLVVAGSSFFINPSNPAMAPGNRDLFLNMVSWTLNRKEGASISPKYFFSLPFQADGVATLILLAVFVVLIPGGILAAGVVLWLRRKNR